MDLILWRHADAGIPRESDDLARPLSKKGEKQAGRVAAWLDRQLPEQVRVLSSAATRADQTAKALGRPFKHRAELLPDSLPEQVLELIHAPKYSGTLVLVGHQPTLGRVAAALLRTAEPELAIKKAAVWWFRIQTFQADARKLATLGGPEPVPGEDGLDQVTHTQVSLMAVMTAQHA